MPKVLLIILDGFGLGKKYPGNAYFMAKKPNLESYFKKYPWVKLRASGPAVGTPEGTQGGSEVGHFTIGAGRMVFQTLASINRSIADKSFFRKKEFLEACRKVREANKKNKKAALHLLGMISDQGVHSHMNHLFALLELAKKEKAFPVFIHAILDGRDVPEKSGKKFLKQIQQKIRDLGLDQEIFPHGPKKACVASLIGRYYAMDRDMNWLRTKKAYNLYALGKGKRARDPIEALEKAYREGAESDYYVPPIIITEDSPSHSRPSGRDTNLGLRPDLCIRDCDSVIFWNFRTDRNRQLTRAFTGETSIGFKPKKAVRPFFVCMGPYSKKAKVAFPTPIVKNNLGAVLSRHRIRQLRIAETEKYAHVTYFVNSQIEKPFLLEDRILIRSRKCQSYAEKPEMSAYGITERLIKEIAKEKYGFAIVNFANCDLVGHSGVLKAAMKAVEIIDECLEKIVQVAMRHGYKILITGDHGNVEYMIYDRNPPTGKTPGKVGEPCPSHTTNPVPFIIAGASLTKPQLSSSARGLELQDIAPTILKLLNIPKPKEMTGQSLVAG